MIEDDEGLQSKSGTSVEAIPEVQEAESGQGVLVDSQVHQGPTEVHVPAAMPSPSKPIPRPPMSPRTREEITQHLNALDLDEETITAIADALESRDAG